MQNNHAHANSVKVKLNSLLVSWKSSQEIKETEKLDSDERGKTNGGIRRRDLFARTQMCAFYLAGTCTRGTKCTYAHSDREMHGTPDLYKTALCAEFVNGNCTNSMNCTYAHGIHEIRSAPETFKTSICRYFNKGDCKHGCHCRYSHDVQKMKKPLLENLCLELLAMRKQHEEEFRERLSKEKSVLQHALGELTNQLQAGEEVSEVALAQLAQYSQDTQHLFELYQVGVGIASESPKRRSVQSMAVQRPDGVIGRQKSPKMAHYVVEDLGFSPASGKTCWAELESQPIAFGSEWLSRLEEPI